MKKIFKRYLALVLTFALVLAVPFVFTQQADAAAKKSKTPKITQPVKVVETYKNDKGKTAKLTTKVSHNKNGFTTKAYAKGKDGFKRVFKYNKKGYLKSYKYYNGKGKLEYKVSVKMNKKGMPVQAKHYDVAGKKSTLVKKVSFIYSGKTPVKYTVQDLEENTTETFDIVFGEYEDEKESYSEGWAANIKKDKKGRVISESDPESGVVFTYKYNKKGYRSKLTAKGSDWKTVETYRTVKVTKKIAKLDTMNECSLGWSTLSWY